MLRRRDVGRSEFEKESDRNEPTRDFNGKGGKKKYGETKNRSPDWARRFSLKGGAPFLFP